MHDTVLKEAKTAHHKYFHFYKRKGFEDEDELMNLEIITLFLVTSLARVASKLPNNKSCDRMLFFH